MNVLITGAAGNLGSFLARSMSGGEHALRLMIHRRQLPYDIREHSNASVFQADLEHPDSAREACAGMDCVVHFAGQLFAPRPERFLPRTNVEYVRHLLIGARAEGVGKFILISFPQVEGESTPERPAKGRMEGVPDSIHARTRLEAERLVFASFDSPAPIALRAGMIYGEGVLMIEAAKWLMRRRLMAIWREPTWIHLISLTDFLQCVRAAIDKPDARGIYNLGDDEPTTLQSFLDAAALHWKLPKPWRLPAWIFPLAGTATEAAASLLGTASPLTRDFIRIGMASYVMDTDRMKRELLPNLRYPTLLEGLAML
jgi:nucleoside-diphosphate-sugar epimerase